MALAFNKDFNNTLLEKKEDVRKLVLAGLQQIEEGNTKDFNTVCDRLEKKYLNEAVRN